MRQRRVAVAAAVLALAGCAADRVAGIAASRDARPPVTQRCGFTLDGVEDRRDRGDLGQIGRTVVGADGFEAWLARGLDGCAIGDGASGRRRVRLVVFKAYVQGIGTMKAANLVVRARFFREGQPWKEADLRGVDNSINWANGEGEIQEALERALADLRRQVQDEVQRMCAAEAAD